MKKIQVEFKARRALYQLLAGNSAALVVQLITVPILIYLWGVSKYSIWLVLATVPSLIAMADFGVVTVSNNMSQDLWIKGRFEEACKAHNSGVVIILILAFVVSIVFYFLQPIINKNIFNDLSGVDFDDADIVVQVLLVDAWVALFANHMASKLRWFDRYDQTIKWQSIIRLIPMLSVLGISSIGADMLGAAFFSLATRLVIFIKLNYFLSRREVIRSQGFSLCKAGEFRALLFSSLSFSILPISNAVYLHVTVITIASMFGPVIAAEYSTVRTITRLPLQFITAIGRSVWSEVVKMGAEFMWSECRTLLLRTIIKSVVVAIVSMPLAYVVVPPAYAIWTGGNFAFNNVLFCALLMNSLVISICTNIEVFILALNKYRRYSLFFLVFTLIQYFLGCIFSEKYGVEAFAWSGSLVSVFIVAFVVYEALNLTKREK